MTDVTLGAVLLPQVPPERARDVARAADEAGLDELWLWEDLFLAGGLATAGALLGSTGRLRVGLGVLPVPLRNVAITAMEAAALERIFPGRVRLGVGHGVQDWMGQVGVRAESPMTLMTEYLDALRALLRGERVDVRGRYVHLDDVALDWPPDAPTAVLLGATGPKSLRLAGARADGVVLSGGQSPDRVRQQVALLDEGRAAAGATGPRRVVVYVHAATGPDAAERLEAERVRWGYGSMGDVAVAGGAAAVAEGLHRWVAAGADTVVLQPTPDDPDPAGFVRFVAAEVAPLLA